MSRPFDVALATCAELPDGAPYDAPLLAALHAAGLTCTWADWDDNTFEWSSAACVLVRSPRGYYLRADQFVDWAQRVAATTTLWNPAPLIRWNHDKRYLLALANTGIPIVPTTWCDGGLTTDLAALLDAQGWTDAVVKPVVSAGAWNTRRVHRDALRDAPLPDRPMMVQPYLASVEDHGERCYVFFNDGLHSDADPFSHVVRKNTPLEPFDVVAEAATSVDDELALARRVIARIRGDWLYARVDTMRDADGTPLLGELELMEPNLFFTTAPGSAERFVRAFRAR